MPQWSHLTMQAHHTTYSFCNPLKRLTNISPITFNTYMKGKIIHSCSHSPSLERFSLPHDNAHRNTSQYPSPQIHKDDDECWSPRHGTLQELIQCAVNNPNFHKHIHTSTNVYLHTHACTNTYRRILQLRPPPFCAC